MSEKKEKITVDKELLKKYVGNKLTKYEKRFSLETFVLGVLYVFYKKMYILGIIWLAIIGILEIFINNFVFIAMIILNIIFSLIFNRIYLKSCEKKVLKIVDKNKEKENVNLDELCTKKGKNSYISLVIGLIILLIILSFSSFGEKVSSDSKIYIGDILSNKEELNKLHYVVPNGYVYESVFSTTNDRKSYTLNKDNNSNFISVNLHKVPDYGMFNNLSDLMDYCTYVTKSKFKMEDFKKEKINGDDWYIYNYNEDGDKINYLIHFQGHNKDNYVIEFRIRAKNYKSDFEILKSSLDIR